MAGRTVPPKPVSSILQRAELALAEQSESSPIFGDLILRELTRRQWRSVSSYAQLPDDPTKINIDLWNAGIFAAGVIDPETGERAVTAEELLDLSRGDKVWDEILRVGNLIMELSEVGQDALKSEDPATPAE